MTDSVRLISRTVYLLLWTILARGSNETAIEKRSSRPQVSVNLCSIPATAREAFYRPGLLSADRIFLYANGKARGAITSHAALADFSECIGGSPTSDVSHAAGRYELRGTDGRTAAPPALILLWRVMPTTADFALPAM